MIINSNFFRILILFVDCICDLIELNTFENPFTTKHLLNRYYSTDGLFIRCKVISREIPKTFRPNKSKYDYR